ncbi:MAG: tetratricopeptide repeat protein, partial [Armatimonadota bacterium]|nr:tetratricopeptide repeat protein [Armatimonadota bacterium]
FVRTAAPSADTDAAYVQIGYILLKENKDMAGALAAYRAAAAGDNQAAASAGWQGEMSIASSYLQDSHPEEAAPIFESLVNSLDPQIREGALYGRSLALVKMKDVRSATAVDEYTRAFPLAQGAGAVCYALGANQFNDRSYAAAMTSFQKAAGILSATPAANISDRTPLKSAALYWAGEASRQAQQPQGAISFWEEELKADPNYKQGETEDSLLGLSTLYAGKGLFSDAARCLAACLDHYAITPVVADTLMDVAGQAVAAHHPAEAIQLYKQFADLAPKSEAGAAAQLKLGLTYLKLDPPDQLEALKALQDAQVVAPKGPLAAEAALSEGQLYETLTPGDGSSPELNLQRALTAYRRAAATPAATEGAALAAWRIGAIEGKLGQVDRAVQDLDGAATLYPKSTQIENIVFEKAHVLQQGLRNAPALVAFRSYLARFPVSANGPAAQFNIALIEYNMAAEELVLSRNIRPAPDRERLGAQVRKDFLNAAVDFDAALAANSPLVPADSALFYGGWAYINAGQPAPAILSFKKLIETHPESPRRLEATARVGILEALSNPAEAIRYLQPYMAGGGNDANGAEARLALGEALEETGDPIRAMPLLQAALNGTNGAPSAEIAAAATFYEAKCFLARGNRLAARATFQRIIVRFGTLPAWTQRATVELQRLGNR